MKTISPIALALAWSLSASWAQNTGRFTLRPELLALPECVAQPGAVPIPLSTNTLNLEVLDWRTAPTATNQAGEFVLRLKQPVRLGTVLAYEPGQISWSLSNRWTPLSPGADAARKLQVVALPPNQLVDGLRFVVPAQPTSATVGPGQTFQATLPFVALFPPRIVNVAPEARVTVSSRDQSAAAGPNQPALLNDGVVEARSNFKMAPRDTNAPSGSGEWVVLSWEQPRKLRGVALFRGEQDAGFEEMGIDLFSGQGDPQAAATTSGAWQFADGIMAPPGRFRGMQFFVFYGAAETRGLRVRSLGGARQAGLGEIAVFSPSEEGAAGGGPPEKAAGK